MANISLANLSGVFSITGTDVAHSGSTEDDTNDVNRVSWISSTGADIDLNGVYSNQSATRSGFVFGVTIDLQNDSPAKPDIAVTRLNLPVGVYDPVLKNTGEDTEGRVFWRYTLIGEDTIRFGTRAYDPKSDYTVTFAGDGAIAVDGENVQGNRDTMTGSIGKGVVSGDVAQVLAGASVFGGNDKMTLSGNAKPNEFGGILCGDSWSLVGGFLEGGADTISALKGIAYVYGDAYGADRNGTVRGGDDVIAAKTALLVFADVYDTVGVVIAGDDRVTGSAFNDQLYGDAFVVEKGGYLEGGADTLRGGAGADILFGDVSSVEPGATVKGGADKLYGDAGQDVLYGNAGNDTLNGGNDTDTLAGGAGRDALLGGSGKDTFVFDATLNARTNVDRLADFSHADDTLKLADDVFAGLQTGALPKAAFKLIASATSTTGVDSNDRILYDKAHGNIYFDADGSGKAHERVLFATATAKTVIDASDIIVF